ncbi:response regulator [Pedobacter aquatilis]|uniref:response regulator transcription factor n=1 Tax=Pedobacter aquatilis TaxID=351343 RepID=UPI0025B5E526|nr:response regulator [Pedobacter aquatilis]MDN3588281.1 response regulator [Pedobacter aquatilis]
MEEKIIVEATIRQNLKHKFVILLVDDEEDILEYVADVLSEKYKVLTACNGLKALKILNQEIVQLVISDVMMPEMDGYQLCEKIKSNFEYSHIPVILLTAKTGLQATIDGLEVGADAYVEKPFNTDFLQVQVSSLLKNRDKIKAYFASSPLIHINSMAHSKSDELFLEKLQNLINQRIDDAELGVDYLADNMNMSRPTLYRKIKSISNLSGIELINITRLKKAAELLNDGELKIYEISQMVGYNSHKHFSRSFSKQFGMSPTEYTQSKQR